MPFPPWSSTSNANSIASALATAIQSADSGFLRLTVSGPTITLYSTTPGAAANWSVMASADDSLPPTTPSFSVMTSGMSGGTNGTVTLGLLYGYAIPTTGGFAPNGNLMNVSDLVMGSWSYGYDNLNRVTGGSASSGTYMGVSIDGATLGWQYDSFGNRKVQSSNFAGFPTGSVQFTGANNQATGTGQADSPEVSTETLQYDAAGNLTGKNYNPPSSAYDGEGRLCATANTTGGYTQYIYDADGNRIAKGSINSLSCNLGSNNFSATNSYVVGATGEQLTEINVQSGGWKWDHSNVFASIGLLATYTSPATGSETTFALNDWLGTKRVEITPDGKTGSFQSLPFGDGLTSSGTAADATEHHFTGKERDAESGLDYFGARYYASTMSRFMLPDPMQASTKHLMYPQRWNAYAYVRNNPLNSIDPDGWDDFKIFLNFSSEDVGGNNMDAAWINIAAQARANGHTVSFVSPTAENYRAALESDSHVIDVGHTQQVEATGQALGVLMKAEGGTGELGNTYVGVGLGELPIGYQKGAKSVDIFGCNSNDLSGQYNQAGTFVGVSSGTNAETNAVTLTQAGQAFLQAATSQNASQPVNLDQAAAAAQKVIDGSQNTTLVDGVPTNIDKDDKVRVHHNQ